MKHFPAQGMADSALDVLRDNLFVALLDIAMYELGDCQVEQVERLAERTVALIQRDFASALIL